MGLLESAGVEFETEGFRHESQNHFPALKLFTKDWFLSSLKGASKF